MEQIDKNLNQLREDAFVFSHWFANQKGMLTLYDYFKDNLHLIQLGFEQFKKGDPERLLALSKMSTSHVSGKFFDKERVESFYDMFLNDIDAKIQVLKVFDHLIVSAADDMQQIALIFGALMYFSDTSKFTLDRSRLINMSRVFVKNAAIKKETLNIYIKGGFMDGENEKEFNKLDFAGLVAKLKFAAEAQVEIPENQAASTEPLPLIKDQFHRVIYFKEEDKSAILNELKRKGFTIFES